MKKTLEPALLQAIGHLDTCTVANAIEQLDVRLRNEGYTDGSVQCMFPRREPVIGYAVTIKIRTSNPPTSGASYPDRTDWWNYILKIPSPRIVVIQDIDRRPGRGAFLGEVHAHIWRALKCVGALTNGAVRDVPALREMDFPVWASHPIVSHAYTHVTEIGPTVEIAGLTIKPGDLLHGDCHGVQQIPLGIAERIPATAAEGIEQDRAVVSLCRSSGFTVEKLRALVAEVSAGRP